MITEVLVIICASVASTLIVELISERLRAHRIEREKEELKGVSQRVPLQAINEEAISQAEKALVSEDGDRQAAFLKLTGKVEASIREIASSAQIGVDTEELSVLEIMKILLKRGIVDSVMFDALRSVWDFRNQAMHGSRISERDLRMANDIAVSLITILYSQKHTAKAC